MQMLTCSPLSFRHLVYPFSPPNPCLYRSRRAPKQKCSALPIVIHAWASFPTSMHFPFVAHVSKLSTSFVMETSYSNHSSLFSRMFLLLFDWAGPKISPSSMRGDSDPETTVFIFFFTLFNTHILYINENKPTNTCCAINIIPSLKLSTPFKIATSERLAPSWLHTIRPPPNSSTMSSTPPHVFCSFHASSLPLKHFCTSFQAHTPLPQTLHSSLLQKSRYSTAPHNHFFGPIFLSFFSWFPGARSLIACVLFWFCLAI